MANDTFTVDETTNFGEDDLKSTILSWFQPRDQRILSAFQLLKDGELNPDQVQEITIQELDKIRAKYIPQSIYVKKLIGDAKIHLESCQGGVTAPGVPSEDVISMKEDLKRFEESNARLHELLQQFQSENGALRKKMDYVVSTHNASLEEMGKLEEQYERLLINAKEKLQIASNDYETLVLQHEEDTQKLKMQVSVLQSLVNSDKAEMECLREKNVQLTAVCKQFLEQIEVEDENAPSEA